MNIAVIAPTEIPTRHANSIQVMKMAQALVILGHNVRLAAPGENPLEDRGGLILPDPGQLTKRSPQDIQDLVWQNFSQHYGIKHQFPIEWLPAASNLRRYDFGLRAVHWARNWKADLLYTRLPQSAAIASTTGMATILETHDLPQGFFGPWIFHRFIKGSGARRLVVITQALATDISEKLGIPCSPPFTVIAPDGVDLDRYSHLPVPSEARLTLARERNDLVKDRMPVDRFTVGYTGHLYQGRGMEMFLELASRLPDFTFLIVGGEPQQVSYQQGIVNDKKLANVIITGFIPNSDLPRYQAACDVLIMPYQRRVAASSGGDISRYLSPMKLFEYLACERAIISSDLPVLQEILNPRNAILLSGADIESWASALKKLHSDPELRKRLSAQARLDSRLHTWESRASRILEGLEK